MEKVKCEGDFLLLHIYRALAFIVKLETSSSVTEEFIALTDTGQIE